MATSFFLRQKFKVNSYHNFVIEEKNLDKDLEVIARGFDDTIEFFKHKKYKIYGVMWHPEREKNYNNLNKIINFILKK